MTAENTNPNAASNDEADWTDANTLSKTVCFTDEELAKAKRQDLCVRMNSVQGIYRGIRTQKTRLGDMRLYEIELPTGEMVNVMDTTVLKKQFSTGFRRGPIPVDNEVRITYLGMEKGKNGNEYKNFRTQSRPVLNPFEEASVSNSMEDSAASQPGANDTQLPF